MTPAFRVYILRHFFFFFFFAVATMPTSTTGAMQSAADGAGGHAAMKKQWQTNLEIDLLKNAWIRKDREQYGAHSTPPLSAAK